MKNMTSTASSGPRLQEQAGNPASDLGDTQPRAFKDEVLIISDDQNWVWAFMRSRLEKMGNTFIRLPSSVRIRHSWQRFKSAQKIVIHWENRTRGGGAILEEMLEVAPNFDISESVIVLTTNPTHEDVVYFGELGIKQVIKLRNRDKDLQKSGSELEQLILQTRTKNPLDLEWRRLQKHIDSIDSETAAANLPKILHRLSLLAAATGANNAKTLDAHASIAALQGDADRAERLWLQTLDKNPNHFRSYHKLVEHYRRTGRPQRALHLMQKLQVLNTANISRLVHMGEIHYELDQPDQAEHFYRSALERDTYCSGALNGLAELRFFQGQLEESRRLLARSTKAYKMAAKLNVKGITLVRKAKYREALDHYTKAQYVLPQQDKSPLLFYNIALCYARWQNLAQSIEFLRIALAKEPNYKKAQRMLHDLEARLEAQPKRALA